MEEAAAGGSLRTELRAARRGAGPKAEGASPFSHATNTVEKVGLDWGWSVGKSQDTTMEQNGPVKICCALSFLSRLFGCVRLRPTTLSFRCHCSRFPLGNRGAFARSL